MHISTDFNPNKDEHICVHSRPRIVNARGCVCRSGSIWSSSTRAGFDGLHTWQVNVRVPPSLAAGSHFVRIRTGTSDFSNAVKIIMLTEQQHRSPVTTVFSPAERISADPPHLISVESTLDRSMIFQGYRNERMNWLFSSPEQDLAIDSVELQIDGQAQPILAVGRANDNTWQINLKVNRSLSSGEHTIQIRTSRSPLSNSLSFTFSPAIDWNDY